MILSNVTSFLPECALLIFLVIVLLLRFFGFKNVHVFSGAFLIGIALTSFLIVQQFFFGPHLFFADSVSFDSFGSLLKAFLIIGFILSIFLRSFKIIFVRNSDIVYYSVLLFSSFISVSSNNLLLTFLGFELLDLSYFTILKLNIRKDSEPGNLFSYYRSWLISSALMLFGISVLYGLFGTLNYTFVSDFLSKNPVNSLTLSISVLMVFAGFAMKMFVFPFQSLLTESFSGLGYSNLSVILITSVITGSGALVRFVTRAFHDQLSYDSAGYLSSVFSWKLLLVIMFCLSVLSSALILFLQRDFRKVLLYFLLINIPFLLISDFDNNGNHLAIYLFNVSFNVTAILSTMYISDYYESVYSINKIKDLRGQFAVSKLPALMLVLILLCNIGLPLTMGFAAKLFIFAGMNQSYIFFVSFSAAAAALISAYVLYKLISTGFVKIERTMQKAAMKPKEILIIILLLIIIILFGLQPQLITNLFQHIVIT